MNSTALNPSNATNDPAVALAALRGEIDRLDDAIHDLLMARAEVVAQVAAQGGKGRVALRPGREAGILRRLLGRHHGPLPRQAVIRVWRELLAATTSMQGAYAIAVCQPGPGHALARCAREHFGALTALRVHATAAPVLAEVAAGTATAAVLPLPAGEDAVPWWVSLAHPQAVRLHVVARLPFWRRPAEAPSVEALVVAAVPPDPSGDDRSLIALDVPSGYDRQLLDATLDAAGFGADRTLLCRGAGVALLDVAGFVAGDDPRLAALAGTGRPPVVIGAYAVPVEGET